MRKLLLVRDIFCRLNADFVRFVDRDGVEIDMMSVEDTMFVLDYVETADGEYTVKVDVSASDFAAA